MHQYMEYGHQHQNGGYQPRFNRMNSGGSHQSNYSQGGNNHSNQQQDGTDKKKKKKRNQQNNKDFNRRNSHDGTGSNIAAGRRQEFGNNSIITNGNGQNQFRRSFGGAERNESVNTNDISNVNGTPHQTRRDGVSPNSGRQRGSSKGKGDHNKTSATGLQRDASFTKQDFPELGNKDFPDLTGKKDTTSGASTPAGAIDTPPKSGTSVDEKKLVGYASALLKKNPSPAPNDNRASITSTSSPLSAEESEEARQTYEMEREILSEFHDLSMHDADEHDITADAAFVDNEVAKEDNNGASSSDEGLPILPTPKKNDSTLDSCDSDPPSSSKDTGPIPPNTDGESNDQYTGESDQTVADPKPNGAWGKKLMFSDVSSLFIAIIVSCLLTYIVFKTAKH